LVDVRIPGIGDHIDGSRQPACAKDQGKGLPDKQETADADQIGQHAAQHRIL
jgi:hypothetical protein